MLRSACLACTLLLALVACIAARPLIGINLGNTLEGGSGVPAPTYFSDFYSVGMRIVRIPVRWDAHTASTPPYTISPSWLVTVNTTVYWCLSANLTCIINSHHDDWLDNATAFDASLPRFRAIWTQVAALFAGAPLTLQFEVFNEPYNINATQVGPSGKLIQEATGTDSILIVFITSAAQRDEQRDVLGRPRQ